MCRRILVCSVASHGAGNDACRIARAGRGRELSQPFDPRRGAVSGRRHVRYSYAAYWAKTHRALESADSDRSASRCRGADRSEIVARSQPDGYTIVVTEMGSVLISWLSHPKPSFDYLRDLTPVTAIAYMPHTLCVHPSLPAKSVKELIALAKQRPGHLNFAASLAGAPLMAGMDFAQRAGIKWTYITGRGGMQTIMDVITGQADAFFNGMLPTVPHIQSGRLRLLAVSSDKRVESFPNIPTIAESGMPGFLTGSWQGVLVPAATPPEIIAKLHAEIGRALKSPDVIQKLAVQGTEPRYNSPAETAKALQAERERLEKLIRETNFKPGQQ